MSDVISVARQIESAVEAIKKEGLRSQGLIEAEATAMRDYDKSMAIKCIAHKAAGVAVGMIDRLAKGDSSDQLFNMIVAQKTLKAHWERLSCLKAQLNALQSVFRHLSHT